MRTDYKCTNTPPTIFNPLQEKQIEENRVDPKEIRMKMTINCHLHHLYLQEQGYAQLTC